MRSSAEDLPRRVDEIVVAGVGQLAEVDCAPGFVLLDPDGLAIAPVTEYFLALEADDYSRHTIRAYGLSLLRYFRFCWAIDIDWQHASGVEARDFILWMRQAKKFVGNRRNPKPRPGRNLVTTKLHLTARYSPKTINHSVSTARSFYYYQLSRGIGPVLNPFDQRRGGRAQAHHNPEEDFDRRRRDPLRQKESTRVPRAIPDEKFNQIFRRLKCNRDRALATFYVSSGARASELLGLTGDLINVGDQLIGVIRKGGELQWIPAAPDAFVWLRLYELERGPVLPGEPVWLTMRGDSRPLSYDAMRAVLAKINVILGANWTLHDLRHTFSIRALEGGMGVHEVQKLLGHASLQTTSVYTVASVDDVIQHYQAVMRGEDDVDLRELPSPGASRYDQNELDFILKGPE